MDRIPTPVLEECIKAIRHGGINHERIHLRALLDLYQDMPLQILTNESNDVERYRRLEGVRRYFSKEFKVRRELNERARDPKEYVTLGNLKSIQYVSGVPGKVYNPFLD